MVGHDAHRNVAFGIVAVTASGHGGDTLDGGLEYIGVVVRLLALKDHAEALEAHTRIYVLGRQGLQLAVGLAVELHEDQIPYLDHQMVTLVDHLAARHGGNLRIVTQVEVNLAARAARARLAHLPEVVVLVTLDYMVFGKVLFPIVVCLLVERHAVGLAALEDGGVHALLRQMVDLREKLPSPCYGLLLEVVAERPVAEHLEHRVVVGVVSHLLQIVVFARYAQTLLRIGHTRIFTRCVAQKNLLELIHSGIGKHQRGVVLHHHRRRRHDRVLLAAEKVEKSLSDFVRFHIYNFAYLAVYIIVIFGLQNYTFYVKFAPIIKLFYYFTI